jgi:hypothetical protein
VVPGSVQISFGQADLGSIDNFKSARIEYLAIHPDFESGGHLNHDIAILRTEKELEWEETLRPICLPDTEVEEYFATKACNVTVAGWGNTHCQSGMLICFPINKRNYSRTLLGFTM